MSNGWMVLQCTLIIYCIWSFVLDRSDGVSMLFLSSPLLRWITCARWSDWATGVQTTILVLGFLFRWFQYLWREKGNIYPKSTATGMFHTHTRIQQDCILVYFSKSTQNFTTLFICLFYQFQHPYMKGLISRCF